MILNVNKLESLGSNTTIQTLYLRFYGLRFGIKVSNIPNTKLSQFSNFIAIAICEVKPNKHGPDIGPTRPLQSQKKGHSINI